MIVSTQVTPVSGIEREISNQFVELFQICLEGPLKVYESLANNMLLH